MKISKFFRINEIVVLLYRLMLVFLVYQLLRALFYYYNNELVQVESIQEYIKLAYYGTAFDTTAILYVNSLFILLSILPLVINTRKLYQDILFYVYFVTNGIAMAMNFGDFIYFKFSQARLTMAAVEISKNETNLLQIFWASFLQQPSVFIWFFVILSLWIVLYKRVKVNEKQQIVLWKYFVGSLIVIVVTGFLVVGGIRGDFKHSTRPINMVDASRHTANPTQANLVLNSTFSFFRTIGKNGFKEVQFVEQKFIDKNIKPYKLYINDSVKSKPNIVIFILESFGKEYSGAFNIGTKIQNFQSYTPFIDSLAQHSLIASDAYANGRQSIHGMSSILAGIPSLTDAFTSSPYANQKIQSIVSVTNDMGYETSFFHGAPNGSMGFQGFGNILGFKKYFGKDEFNNDKEFDGIWGIWDEPFFQFFAHQLDKSKKPFMSTMFSVSSHHPFNIPEKYKGKFKKGTREIHEPIQYTDYSLKKFFETAKKMEWYNNTLFVLVADHTNQTAYPEYEKIMNRFAVPILFFSPNQEYQLKGRIDTPTQQMDIYPTLAHLIGYNKPIRSWGRSLLANDDYLIVNSDSMQEQFIIGNYIYRFNGKEISGVYHLADKSLSNNIKDKVQNAEIEKGKMLAKAWYQDYMFRVINKKL